MNLVLIGSRASGKTTIGRLLAAELKLPFIDLDDRALMLLGMTSVREVWKTVGESKWREAETKSLAEVLREDGQVIALGGGVPIIAAASAMIQSERASRRIRVIYLRCSADVLSRRLQESPGDRPSLTGDAIEREVAAVLAQREPTYRALADIVIDAAQPTPPALVRELIAQLNRR